MEYDQIKKLIDDMGNSNLSSINIEFPNGLKVDMKKDNTIQRISINENQIKETEKNQDSISKEKLEHIIKSPMVGMFYTKPSPTAKSYVEEGMKVKTGDTLCIIEAMKLMNEIESEFTGKVTKIFVEDGTPVEYGTPLFKIE